MQSNLPEVPHTDICIEELRGDFTETAEQGLEPELGLDLQEVLACVL